MAEVRFAQVACVFPGASRAAVDDVDLTVRDGELLVLTGPTGSGKTTLVRLLAGLESVSRGSLHVGARDVTRETPDKRGVALISGGLALFPRLSVADNIALPLTLRRVSARASRALIREAAERCGVADHLAAQATELDFELRLRTALARALVRRPDAVCVDDPLDEGDTGQTGRLFGLVARLQREAGVTLISTTGTPRDARRVADRIAVLDGGRLQQAGLPAEVLERPATLAAAEFVGAGEMNFAETVVRDGEALLGRQRVPLSDPQVKALTGERVVVGIRHCDLVIGAREGFSALVLRIKDLGSHAVVLVLADIHGPPTEFQIRHVGPAPPLMLHVTVGVVGDRTHFFDPATGARLPD